MVPKEFNKTITRREFFAGIVPVFSIPVLLWWFLTGKRSEMMDSVGESREIPGIIPAGISFYDDVVIINDGKTKRAFRAKCTHLGCTVPWVESEKLFKCPCHSSVFNIQGEVLQPPAPRPLDIYNVVIENNIVTVDTDRKIKRDKFDTSQVVYG